MASVSVDALPPVFCTTMLRVPSSAFAAIVTSATSEVVDRTEMAVTVMPAPNPIEVAGVNPVPTTVNVVDWPTWVTAGVTSSAIALGTRAAAPAGAMASEPRTASSTAAAAATMDRPGALGFPG